MSIFKAISRNQRNVKDMIAYVCDGRKTNSALVLGCGINPDPILSYGELELVSDCWSFSLDKRAYHHFIFSFDAGILRKITFADVKAIVLQIASLFYVCHQVLAAVHVNTDNIHAHFVVFKVNLYTGKKFRQNRSLYWYKCQINLILAQYKLEPIHYFGLEEGDVDG